VVPVGSLVEPGRIKQTKPAAINYSGMVITSVEDGVVRVLDLDNDIIHLLSGDSTPIGSTTVSASDYFPEDGIGVLSGYDVYIDGLFNSLDTGFEMWASNPSLGGGSSGGIDLTEAITQDKDKVFPIGISLCVDNSCVLLITNQTSVTQTNADEWWLIEINSENTASVLIESGTCSSMPGDINSYGFGNRGYFHFNSFSLESNREYAWAVNGWGYGNVRCYQKSGTSLTLLFDLISGIPVPYAHKPTIYADDGIAWVAASNYTAAFTRNERITTDLVSVGSVVSDICIDSGLSESDIDVTDLTDAVGGYVRTRPMTARAAIEPLMMAYYFDAVESDGKIKFVKRGGS
ncbi:MAG: hypothetical protein GY750_06560, partial [Lentisphaerae bacterium]|nr:hypothetical protein [Lentisphaerota bacterium]